jgi:putative ABC transport system substrate-binding protein
MITRRHVVIAGASLIALPGVGRAQRRLWRIGFHSNGSAQSNAGWLDAFRAGMAELGWSEAQHYVIDARYADGNSAVAQRFARELVATQPDLILTTADASINSLVRATRSVPIVFTGAADPVGHGYAKSLQRPGGNATGITSLTPDLGAKRLQLLKEAFPPTRHLLLLYESSDPAGVSQARSYESGAEQMNVRLTPRDIRQPSDLGDAFAAGVAAGVNACAIISGPLINIHRKVVAEQALQAKLPSIASNPILTDVGVLMAYGTSTLANFRRAAVYVDKILKGLKPADLAIEQPRTIDLVINARTAKALGLTLPSSLQLRASRIIE